MLLGGFCLAESNVLDKPGGDPVPFPLPVFDVRIQEPVYNGVLDQLQSREYHAHAARLAQLRRQLSSMHLASANAIRASLGKVMKATSFVELNPGRLGGGVDVSASSTTGAGAGSRGVADDAAARLGSLITQVTKLNGGGGPFSVSNLVPGGSGGSRVGDGSLQGGPTASAEQNKFVQDLEDAAVTSMEAKLSQAPDEIEIMRQLRAALKSTPTRVGKAPNLFEMARNIPLASFLQRFGGGVQTQTSGFAKQPYQKFVVAVEESNGDIVENRRNQEEKRAENQLMADLAVRRARAARSLEKIAALEHLTA